jgi:hypothetical protein
MPGDVWLYVWERRSGGGYDTGRQVRFRGRGGMRRAVCGIGAEESCGRGNRWGKGHQGDAGVGTSGSA